MLRYIIKSLVRLKIGKMSTCKRLLSWSKKYRTAGIRVVDIRR